MKYGHADMEGFKKLKLCKRCVQHRLQYLHMWKPLACFLNCILSEKQAECAETQLPVCPDSLWNIPNQAALSVAKSLLFEVGFPRYAIIQTAKHNNLYSPGGVRAPWGPHLLESHEKDECWSCLESLSEPLTLFWKKKKNSTASSGQSHHWREGVGHPEGHEAVAAVAVEVAGVVKEAKGGPGLEDSRGAERMVEAPEARFSTWRINVRMLYPNH